MALVPAKCTNCGGTLEVDNTKEAAVCPHCGSAFIVEKAINYYNTTYHVHNDIHDSVVNIINSNEESPDEILSRANTILKIGDLDKAIKLVKDAVEKNPTDERLWIWLIDNSSNYSELINYYYNVSNFGLDIKSIEVIQDEIKKKVTDYFFNSQIPSELEFYEGFKNSSEFTICKPSRDFIRFLLDENVLNSSEIINLKGFISKDYQYMHENADYLIKHGILKNQTNSNICNGSFKFQTLFSNSLGEMEKFHDMAEDVYRKYLETSVFLQEKYLINKYLCEDGYKFTYENYMKLHGENNNILINPVSDLTRPNSKLYKSRQEKDIDIYCAKIFYFLINKTISTEVETINDYSICSTEYSYAKEEGLRITSNSIKKWYSLMPCLIDNVLYSIYYMEYKSYGHQPRLNPNTWGIIAINLDYLRNQSKSIVSNKTSICPYCGGRISLIKKKCKNCGATFHQNNY